MRYMVTFRPRPDCAAQLREAVPAEQAHSKAMQDAGVVLHLFVSSPGHAWFVVEAADRDEAERLVRKFPMHRYVEAVVDPLIG